jgi:cytochrome c-type biogenesis protein CcmH/NrfG
VAETEKSTNTWTSTQAYAVAAFCLVLGVLLGYLFRGSASPAANMVQAPVANNAAEMPNQAQPTPEERKAALDQALAPLLVNLQSSPNDFDTLVHIANVYYDGAQYTDAIKYYQLAIKDHPENADVLTDLGTAIWYTGDADAAIAQYQKALTIRPNNPGTLFNLGIVRWQGKRDPKGAVEVWQQLLKTNPDYPHRQQVEEIISKAKMHSQG